MHNSSNNKNNSNTKDNNNNTAQKNTPVNLQKKKEEGEHTKQKQMTD